MVDFLKYTKVYAIISALVIFAGVFSIVNWGYRYSIDFVGGTNLGYQINKDIPQDQIRKLIEKQKVSVLETRKNGQTYSIRTKAINEKQELAVRTALENQFKIKVNVLRSETVGPTIGKETIQKTTIASVIAVIGILFYMSYAFKNVNFALAAIVALIHDVLVMVGSYSLMSHFFGAELDTLFVTALLTTMSFSVHDTIIVFDKIREYTKTKGRGEIEEYANIALTETLVRSLNNSMTIVFMLLALVLLGGSTVRFFAATLLIGTITGTYSSPFVATPVAVWLEKRKK
ncbi:protein-export membrane protein SecF [Candidatus Roizmanbacteria bacterium RIFCSPLOWO2_01_FULL_41_22]|uniref:Protein-export membrane protein SecF n=1 Tax=Candidatus Roizmanbacteria bacterium RIFCSPLOWO2_01_FULL_41_22 TaxID=1802067 RepID=A0A1F7J8D1_9BACT|nr:MAG: protein-export membrane protein SecF [Candidatus Roizmanbacteria bacterium RIFCSPLOWO2_01_FULL_41_22]